ncbi:hypothetical protein EW026_g744 [Hermanssonia centrifuga]|uniref:Glutathione hydrolase n=1 Tax=Hermanssonia centrifuga TaxID=98765 RepID=A0A4S4KVL6_9APHY|nr:hypothetical protein EW026_g744 [Hermanssonia centrifuga]
MLPLTKEGIYPGLPVYAEVPRRSHQLGLRHVLLTLLAASATAYVLLGSLYRPNEFEVYTCGSPSCARNPAFLVKAKHGAVASENELCSDIGVKILKKGGNAVDAAISTTLCIGVTNMFSSGIGGGGFMTVRLPPLQSNLSSISSSKVMTIDFREVAPAASREKMYVGQSNKARWGGLAVGVPGELRGLKKAHELWGKLKWSDLVRPNAELAKGWKVSKELERRIEMFATPMHNLPEWKAIFAPNGCLLREEGPDVFYKGPIAESILARIRDTGGIMTQDDLSNYEVKVQPALEGTYRGRKIYTTHAPTSGPVLLHMLNLLEKYEDFAADGRTSLNVHRLIEIIKFGFAARTKVADPNFMERADAKHIDEIPTKAYADYIFPNITDGFTHSPEYYNPVYDVPTDHGTSHSSVLDKDGMAVAITSTVNLIFGSMVLDPVTGVILNDEMDDFSIPGVPNAFGLFPSPSVFQVLANLEWGLDASAAVEYGRVHDQLFPTFVDVDNVYPSEIVEDLKNRGHNITISDISRVAAVVQVITKHDDSIYAASDSRKRGRAAGY